MSTFRRWEDVKREGERVRRQAHPGVGEPEWAARKEAARSAQDAHLVGHHLRRLRRERGLTQTQAAALLGITQARVSQLEQGDSVDLTALRAYAHALGAEIRLVLDTGEEQIRIA